MYETENKRLKKLHLSYTAFYCLFFIHTKRKGKTQNMSFRKAQKSGATDSQRIRGVKPWINGQFLASSGNRDLDQILGGGLTLVSNIVIYL